LSPRSVCYWLLALLPLTTWVSASNGQSVTDNPHYARQNTLGVFAAYSPRVNGIPDGNLAYRELLNLGISYNRRLSLGRIVNWQYSAELMPVALESDPIYRSLDIQTTPIPGTVLDLSNPATTCAPFSEPYSIVDPATNVTYSGTVAAYCQGRRWTIGTAFSPVGMQWNFRPLRKTQPFVVLHGGYMYSTQPVPLFDAGSFNFTFDIGGGIEVFRSRSRSIRAEYRFHHLSNAGTAQENPGVESGLFQLTYCFGFGHQ
jgi:hypothetical protein